MADIATTNTPDATQAAPVTEVALTPLESATLKVSIAINNNAKIAVFTAQTALQKAQDAVTAAQQKQASAEDRQTGAIATILDTKGLDGTWQLDNTITKFVKVS
jgi:hypothetical protein